MSISTDAIIIVGFSFSQISEDREEYFKNLVYEGELETSSIYFDSSIEENIIGVTVMTAYYTSESLDINLLQTQIEATKIKVLSKMTEQEQVNIEIGTYLSLHIS
jgi:hypothetical protein